MYSSPLRTSLHRSFERCAQVSEESDKEPHPLLDLGYTHLQAVFNLFKSLHEVGKPFISLRLHRVCECEASLTTLCSVDVVLWRISILYLQPYVSPVRLH